MPSRGAQVACALSKRQLLFGERSTRQVVRAALTVAALGVVYGDIGTSPLYAVKETFALGHGIPLNVDNVLGGLSAILWVLMIVVSLKYVVLVMRADNRGEGGTMALIALASAAVRKHPAWRFFILTVGLFGASLFFGEAVLTPAISVVSAVEGLEVGTSAFKPLGAAARRAGAGGALHVPAAGDRGRRGVLRAGVHALVHRARRGRHLADRPDPVVLEAVDPRHAFRFSPATASLRSS